MTSSIEKSKETESQIFGTRGNKLSLEQKEVDKVMQQHKLGDWAKGLTNVWEYNADNYENEKKQEELDLKVDQIANGNHKDADAVKEQLQNNERKKKEIDQDNYDLLKNNDYDPNAYGDQE